MERSLDDLGAPLESWEIADLEANINRLMLSTSGKDSSSSSSSASNQYELVDDSAPASAPDQPSASTSSALGSSEGVLEDVINSVDQFLREALQNPRKRLSAHRPPMSADHQHLSLPQLLPGPWTASSSPAGIGYSLTEPKMTPFSPNHVGAHSTSTLYLHSTQHHCQHPGMPFFHLHEQVHQPFLKSHQQQPDASVGD